jgi:hypothetical protein
LVNATLYLSNVQAKPDFLKFQTIAVLNIFPYVSGLLHKKI